ncbi:uncharacterized protein F4812DRAFT_458387 [Daldinia caldariorum]|uniref:uncharacterized protein n=1 Tax=Daldinia caldariorum TaxID=326644 RepID=UPI0020074C81|nr:uncharacterized protein F4812DRAFT_458387 [Daldinia caldariorum]KAI1468861.1 hypothetical protein F4812DRAFT_458387 [Daldinia caldariorum]
MPIRIKSRNLPNPNRSLSPVSPPTEAPLPDITQEDAFRDVVKKLSIYVNTVVHSSNTIEQLRTTSAGDELNTLVDYISTRVTNPAIVNALLALRWHYASVNDSRGISEARADACEIVAWRFLTRISEREAVEFCLHEVTDGAQNGTPAHEEPADGGESNEQTALLRRRPRSPSPDHRSHGRFGSLKRIQLFQSISKLTTSRHTGENEDLENEITEPFTNLNALEIAAIADAKRFLSQHVVQKIITGIWNGQIIFWDHLSVHSGKKARFYNPNTADPFSRLRVPKYLKTYEVAFLIGFLVLYSSVLIEQNRYAITLPEMLLYVWFAAFFYDELSSYIDAGSVFYAADVWNIFDIIMISIGILFAMLRFIGLYKADYTLVDMGFDILSLEALFMVPRVCSIFSLSPYWGTLIPCLKEMGKDFLKFMVLVVIIYVGFLTTFSLVGRETFPFTHMAMIVTKIFFGSSHVGFDVMKDIDPIFGPPLMLIFITLSSILLTGSLTGMLSNSFSRVIIHAREEYLYVYSVYVLEASTSNRLTHFYPPFNLIAVAIFRPLRLFLPSDDKFRQARIVLLRATHAPIALIIQIYEWFACKFNPEDFNGFENFSGPPQNSSERPSTSPPGRQESRPQPERRPESRPQPEHRPESMPQSGHRPESKPMARAASTEEIHEPRSRQKVSVGNAGEAQSGIEERISELAAKIDQLTALVVALQSGSGS